MKGTTVVVDGIGDHLKQMLDRANLAQGWLNRVAYPEILRVQRLRWQTEGSSQGEKWAPIKNDSYKRSKLKRFRDCPGGGSKLLIATARLVQSMTGENKEEHWKLVTPKRLETGTIVPYAKYIEDNGRDITTLSEETAATLADSFMKYIIEGS